MGGAARAGERPCQTTGGREGRRRRASLRAPSASLVRPCEIFAHSRGGCVSAAASARPWAREGDGEVGRPAAWPHARCAGRGGRTPPVRIRGKGPPDRAARCRYGEERSRIGPPLQPGWRARARAFRLPPFGGPGRRARRPSHLCGFLFGVVCTFVFHRRYRSHIDIPRSRRAPGARSSLSQPKTGNQNTHAPVLARTPKPCVRAAHREHAPRAAPTQTHTFTLSRSPRRIQRAATYDNMARRRAP